MPKFKSSHKRKRQPTQLFTVLQAALIACLAVIVLLVFVTLMLSWDWFDQGSITLINTVLKIIGAALAGFIVVKKDMVKPWLTGGLSALLFLVLTVVSMCIFLGEAALGLSLLGDALMCIAVGAATAAIRQALKKRKQS